LESPADAHVAAKRATTSMLIATKPFQRAEAIVLKPSLHIDVCNDAPERRAWALKTVDDIQWSIFMHSG
jgi:hypothetical protein